MSAAEISEYIVVGFVTLMVVVSTWRLFGL